MCAVVSIGEPWAQFKVYAQIGWCDGGPNTPVGNLTYPATVDKCWEACIAEHPEELVAADFWPQVPPGWGGQRCWCQTACTSVKATDHSAENPVELALRKGAWQAVLPDHLQEPGLQYFFFCHYIGICISSTLQLVFSFHCSNLLI